MPRGTPNTVSKTEFETFKSDIMSSLDVILNKIEEKDDAVVEVVVAKQATTASSYTTDDEEYIHTSDDLPPQYQRIFEKYFDPKDGFEGKLELPKQDKHGNTANGLMFTIVVPRKFSTSSDSYLDMHKVDLHSKSLSAGSMPSDIEDWCKLVAQHLKSKYNRNMQSKD